MSVFNVNKTNKNVNDVKMFFDEPINIARYDVQKYPFLEKLVEKQLGFFWVPQEIDLIKDKKDFKDLNKFEQHIFTSNLKRQILLDSVQGRAPALVFGPICSIPELENWITTWTFNESIHSRSYTHIIRNIYADPSVIFDEIMDIKDIVSCAEDISFHYDKLLELSHDFLTGNMTPEKEHEIKKALWLCMVSVNILEGVRFYVSFACSWAFAELKKMEGNAKVIKLICMSDDHEILTDKGWKFFKDLNTTEKVAQYTNTGNIEFVYPINYIEQDFDGKMIHYQTSDVDALYTPEHRIIYSIDGILKEDTAENFKPYPDKSYVVSGIKTTGNINKLSWEDKFRIATQADGHISNRYDGSITGHIPVTFTFKKKHKIERFLCILKELGFVYSEYNNPNPDKLETLVFTVKVPLDFNISKDFSWVNIEEVNNVWAEEFLIELSHWDGHLRYDNFSNIYYSTINSTCMDMVQILCTISGKIHHRAIQIDDRKESYNDVHRISYFSGVTRNCGTNITKNYEYYKGKVYCVTVPSGMIVVRRNNKVVITGNCRDENLHLAGTQQIIKALVKDDPIYATIREETKDECIKLFSSAVEQEKQWAKYLFAENSMIGLNENLLCDYIEWIANKRLVAIGFEPLYKTGSNPLPWTQKWISGSEVQTAPQETNITSYIIGGTLQDMTNETFENFKL